MYIGNREKIVLIVLGVLAVLAYATFSWLGLGSRPADYALKLRAAEKTRDAELAIGDVKDSDLVLSQVADDAVQAAMIGLPTSPITTDPGSLSAKLTSTNPNFAGVIVSLLREAGVRPGDPVAIAYTGSFPALDIASIIAAETLGAEPIIVSSVGASTWGANDPDLTILDMESLLVRKGIIAHKSLAASFGGDFRVRPMSAEGQKAASDAINRNGVFLINSPNIHLSVDDRMRIYQQQAAGKPIKAFINVGGGLPSTGVGAQYDPGLTVAPPRGDITVAGLIAKMSEAGVPVVNLTDIDSIARHYKLPVSPSSTPSPGKGIIYRDWNQIRIVSALLVVTLAGVFFAARFIVLAPAPEEAVDTYFGTAPGTLRIWGRSIGRRLSAWSLSGQTGLDKK